MNVDYVDHMGSDLTVVNTARVSFRKQSEFIVREKFSGELTKELSERDIRLINYLASHNHWTPFAHPQIQLRIKAPISIRTQCFKHKIGFVENEVSRRYVDDEPEFFWPILRQRSDTAKQGSKNEFPVQLEACENAFWFVYNSSKEAYNELIKQNVAPEQARFILPQGMYTEWIWTGSLAAYARFVNLRSDPHAQVEIRELADKVSDIIEPLFPYSWSVLTHG